jgi:hypothetical protein
MGACAIALSVSAAACSGASSDGARPGVTAVHMASHIDRSCALTRLSLSVDGQLRYIATGPDVPPLGDEARHVARLATPPGTHMLGIMATATCKAAAPGDIDPILTLRDARQFLVGDAAPATLLIDLATHEAEIPGERRLDTAVQIKGGELGPALTSDGKVELSGTVDGAGVDDRHCKALEAAPRAICRTEAVVAIARAQKDVVRVLCTQDKLARMRSYATIIERARERAKGAAQAGPPEAGEPAEDQAIIKVAEDRIRALALEVDQCLGVEIMRSEPGSDTTRAR